MATKRLKIVLPEEGDLVWIAMLFCYFLLKTSPNPTLSITILDSYLRKFNKKEKKLTR